MIDQKLYLFMWTPEHNKTVIRASNIDFYYVINWHLVTLNWPPQNPWYHRKGFLGIIIQEKKVTPTGDL